MNEEETELSFDDEDSTAGYVDDDVETEAPRNLLAFFMFGLLNNFAYVVFLSAAEHIFQDHSGAVLLANAAPGLLLKVSYGFGIHTLPYGLRIFTVSAVPFLMFLVVAGFNNTVIRLSAIAFVSLIGGLGESSFLSMTATYKPATIGAWSSGTGAAGIFGAGFYFLMTVVLRLSPRTTLLLSSPFPLMLIATFVFVLGRPSKISVTRNRPSLLIPSAFAEKLPLLRSLFVRFILPLMLVYYFEYTINQGVVPVVNFATDRVLSGRASKDGGGAPVAEGSTARNESLYVTYQMLYQIGVFVSRSSISCVKIHRIWALPVLQLINLLVLLVLVAFVEVASIWLIFLMALWEGLLGGAAYVNTFWNVSHETPSRDREWALGVTTVGDTIGITLSAITDTFLECGLRALRGAPCK